MSQIKAGDLVRFRDWNFLDSEWSTHRTGPPAIVVDISLHCGGEVQEVATLMWGDRLVRVNVTHLVSCDEET